MTNSDEQRLSCGLDILEMTKTQGWKWLEARIREEISIETAELRELNIEKKTAEEIVSEYLQHRSNLNAYERVLEMVSQALVGKEEAARALRRD